jgi:hypothetical protein
VDRDGSGARTLATLPGVPAYASASPDGRTIRFSVVDQRVYTWSLWEVGVAEGVPRRVFARWSEKMDHTQKSWSTRGDYLFVATRNGTESLWVARGGSRWLGRGGADAAAILPVSGYCPLPSRDGDRVFLMVEFTFAQLVQRDLEVGEFVTHPTEIPNGIINYSPNSAWIVYVAFPSNNLWQTKTDGTERRPLTDPPLEITLPL